ncbi:MAG: hypothetical protein G5663_01250 [Serratia symbiotica]|nr:hypothetical protein [Serratia symbiotica]
MTSYHRRLIAETAMYRLKQLFCSHLSLRDYYEQDAALQYARSCRCKATYYGVMV